MPAQNLLVQGESHGNYKRSLGTFIRRGLYSKFFRQYGTTQTSLRAVQNEPGISLLESINRTSTLLESSLINALYEDFGVLKEIIGDPQIDLVVPASLWIDYLSVQKQ